MTGGILGGGVLLAVLALLWIAVLVPTWMANREQRAAEQYAVRLQRTIRLLAETAEVPEEHVVEANAKQALAHEKLLKASRDHEEAQMRTQMKTQQAQQRKEAYMEQQKYRAAKAQARRTRLMTPRYRVIRGAGALTAVFSVLGTLIGIGLALGGVGAAVMWVSLGALVVSAGTLVAIAPGAVPPAVVEDIEANPGTQQVHELPRQATTQAPAPDTAAEAEAYRAAQARAAHALEKARKMARARAELPTTPERTNQTDSILLKETTSTAGPAPASAPAPEHNLPAERRESAPPIDVPQKSREYAAKQRLQQMGVVGDTSKGATSLEEALRKRRNAG